MKKILFLTLVFTSNLQACLCDNFSDIKNPYSKIDHSSYYEQQAPPYSQKQLENSIRDFIYEEKWFELNSLLNKINSDVKKNILSRQISIEGQSGKPFITDFINLAIDTKNCEILTILIKHGAELNLSSNDGFNALTRATIKNLPDIIEKLISSGVKINSYDANGNTALTIATQNSLSNLICFLSKLGADLNLKDSHGFTPLCLAVDHNDKGIINELIKYGADIELGGNDGYSPLNRAVDDNSIKTAELLIKFGAKINAIDKNGNTAIAIAIKKSYTELAERLIQLGAEVTIINRTGNSLLIDALVKNNQQLAETLLAQNVNINLQNFNGKTALHIAIENSYDKLIPLIIKKGADPKIQTDFYVDSILLAASYGKKEITKVLLKNTCPSIEHLKKALEFNDIEAFKILLNLYTNNPFEEPNKNISLIHKTFVLGNKEIIQLCQTSNPDLLNLQIYGHNPLHLTVMYEHNKLARYFIEQCNVNVNSTDYYGATPLHYAAAYGNHEMAEYLITKKCQINNQIQEDFKFYKKGSTPLDLAIQFAHKDLIKLLLAHKAKTNITKKINNIPDNCSNLAIFIDSNVELLQPNQKLTSINTSLSEEIRAMINQKACPIIIIGQHLLNNVLKLSCHLENWTIIEFINELPTIKGYVIIPKNLQNLGFNFSNITHSCVTEEYVLNQKAYSETPGKTAFSETIPTIINKILLPKERIIYWGGHGSIDRSNSTIGNIFKKDAEILFDVFTNKKTKFIYVSSCFFGNTNLDSIKPFKDMTIVAGATTEIATSKMCGINPPNWRGFFDSISANITSNDFTSLLSNQILPLIITQRPHISNFPNIKLPCETKSTILSINNEALLINKKFIENHKSQTSSLKASNKRLIKFDITKIETPILIKNKIPLFISNYSKNIFDQITIENTKKDFIHLIKALTRAHLFKDSTLENLFLIKQLKLSNTFSINLDSEQIKIPKILYNFLIQRGPSSECSVYFNTNSNLNKQSSLGILYDNLTKKWKPFTPLTTKEFSLYQQLLASMES